MGGSEERRGGEGDMVGRGKGIVRGSREEKTIIKRIIIA